MHNFISRADTNEIGILLDRRIGCVGLGDWLMNEDQHTDPRVGRNITACIALALALAVCALPRASQAAGPPGPTAAPGIGALLATDADVLSESAMARQKGSGLRAPPIIGNEPGGTPKVLLWDEMRIAPLLNPPNDGVVTGGTGR
jgi:hypothetical protein